MTEYLRTVYVEDDLKPGDTADFIEYPTFMPDLNDRVAVIANNGVFSGVVTGITSHISYSVTIV